MDAITKTQQSFARKALMHPTHQFTDLYHLICRDAWIRSALAQVLGNSGSRTPGIDGITRRRFDDDAYTATFVAELSAQLKAGTYRPQPARRVYIPKPNGRQRPLGIPIVKDRVVQMLLKMVLEPIWESDFLDCSSGFRPQRRTMDCIAMCYRLINDHNKHYWVIEGDIAGCFDNIHHQVLTETVRKRIRDTRIMTLIERFLKAGVMEGKLFKTTESGTPQGGIVSPLLANIYLTELDRYWWEHYGNLSTQERAKRRRNNQGNCRLIRYADDFVLLTNGPKEEAYRLRDEFQAFLRDTLKLELSPEKTLITHVNEGFDFLGFNIRRYTNPEKGTKPVTLVKPSIKSVERLKAKIRLMTSHSRSLDNPYLKFVALNQILRGWIAYYQHCNVKDMASSLQFWVNSRVAHWLADHHRCGIRKALAMYQQTDEGRQNFAVKTPKGGHLFLYHMDRLPITRYVDHTRTNPYLGEWSTTPALPEEPDLSLTHTWNGSERFQGWLEARTQRLDHDEWRCTDCGSTENLDVHHLHARNWHTRQQGQEEIEQLRTLCEPCHVKLHQAA